MLIRDRIGRCTRLATTILFIMVFIFIHYGFDGKLISCRPERSEGSRCCVRIAAAGKYQGPSLRSG